MKEGPLHFTTDEKANFECKGILEGCSAVVAVTKVLGERGLAFRRNDDLLGSPLNGNYLVIFS